jgi:hypothetical protein
MPQTAVGRRSALPLGGLVATIGLFFAAVVARTDNEPAKRSFVLDMTLASDPRDLNGSTLRSWAAVVPPVSWCCRSAPPLPLAGVSRGLCSSQCLWTLGLRPCRRKASDVGPLWRRLAKEPESGRRCAGG